MNIFDLLKGKKVLVTTNVGVDVELIIKEIREDCHSQELEDPSPSNDWWPKTRDWKTYTVFFTNGYIQKYNSLGNIHFL